MGTTRQRHILFVVGMHRSGTSAVCAALEACGVSFGNDLLAPMTHVNERGFWEAESVVALNEEVLALAGTSWYSLGPALADDAFSGPEFDACRERAAGLLLSGFGESVVEGVKDPRLCLTLPLWLQASAQVGLDYSVCTVQRHPLAIARSLEARDGLPPGYGLRLASHYARQAMRAVPPGSVSIRFEALLESPAEVLEPLLQALPLEADGPALRQAVVAGLRHQGDGVSSDAVAGDWGTIGSEEFEAGVDARYPLAEVLTALADTFVLRGQELTRVGELHAQALAVIEQRDDELARAQGETDRIGGLHTEALATIAEKDKEMAELAGLYEEACEHNRLLQGADEKLGELGEMHSRALAVINERDEQIREFDRRLEEIGGLHSQALARIESLDAQLSYLKGVPVLGRLFGALLHRARR